MKNLKGVLALSVIAVTLLSGCSSPSTDATSFTSEPSPVETQQSQSEVSNSAPDVSYDIPSEWNTTERKIFDGYVLFYPQAKLMNLAGKRALMENANLICQAYSEGYSRREILAAITGGAVTSEMSDDWMTLSVTYLCPEYFDQQRAN